MKGYRKLTEGDLVEFVPLPSEFQFNVASLIISSFGTSSHYSLGKLAAHAFRY